MFFQSYDHKCTAFFLQLTVKIFCKPWIGYWNTGSSVVITDWIVKAKDLADMDFDCRRQCQGLDCQGQGLDAEAKTKAKAFKATVAE